MLFGSGEGEKREGKLGKHPTQPPPQQSTPTGERRRFSSLARTSTTTGTGPTGYHTRHARRRQHQHQYQHLSSSSSPRNQFLPPHDPRLALRVLFLPKYCRRISLAEAERAD